MTSLDDILEVKRRETRELRRRRPASSFAMTEAYRAPVRSLAGAIRNAHRPAIIAEVKKASPSAGRLNPDADPAVIAAGYRLAGAVAVSVLTDRTFFGGSPEDLAAVRAAVDLPLLRKDFIVDGIQLHEARALGADAVLLIAAALGPSLLQELHGLATEIGLECLVEVHDEADLLTLHHLGAGIVGINNRDLRTFAVDTGVTRTIAPLLPPGTLIVSESGLRSAADVKAAAAAGADAVLIGEMFMRCGDPGAALKALVDELCED